MDAKIPQRHRVLRELNLMLFRLEHTDARESGLTLVARSPVFFCKTTFAKVIDPSRVEFPERLVAARQRWVTR